MHPRLPIHKRIHTVWPVFIYIYIYTCMYKRTHTCKHSLMQSVHTIYDGLLEMPHEM